MVRLHGDTGHGTRQHLWVLHFTTGAILKYEYGMHDVSGQFSTPRDFHISAEQMKYTKNDQIDDIAF